MAGSQGEGQQALLDQKRGGLRRVLIFLLVFAALQLGYSSARGGPLERLVIDQITVKVASSLINLFDSAAQVAAQGPRLRSPGGGINILAGCEGVDAMLLLCAAMTIAPISGRRRLLGLAIGASIVFALNQMRVIALFYAYRADEKLFNVLHGTLLPMVIVAAIAGFFIFWCAREPQPQAAPE